MRYPTFVRTFGNGQYSATTTSKLTGDVCVVAATESEAIQKLRGEIIYRLEYCPCTSTDESEVEIVVQR